MPNKEQNGLQNTSIENNTEVNTDARVDKSTTNNKSTKIDELIEDNSKHTTINVALDALPTISNDYSTDKKDFLILILLGIIFIQFLINRKKYSLDEIQDITDFYGDKEDDARS